MVSPAVFFVAGMNDLLYNECRWRMLSLAQRGGLFKVFKTLAGDGFQTLQTGGSAAAPQAGGAKMNLSIFFSQRCHKMQRKTANQPVISGHYLNLIS